MKKVNLLLEKIVKICKENHCSLVTAESCTGGGLAYTITKNPLSSSLLERGFVTYSVQSKEDILKVSSYTLQIFGAVSKEVAIEMAENALKQSKAQISIAITGVDYEVAKEKEKDKPGIAWVSCAGIHKNTVSKQVQIKGNREIFCENLILYSLEVLYGFIKKD